MGFHRWMLGMTYQWMGNKSLRANSVAPVLVSAVQGKQKSSFCKMLVPETLEGYYTDSFDLNSPSTAEQKLALFGLINMDEMDKLSDTKMPLLKNLMQMAALNIRKAYKKNYSPLPRVASFIATSNHKDLLADPTGSRRFLCVEVEKTIDLSPLDHDQVYAQLKAELAAGHPHWFNKEEEKMIKENNQAFQKESPEEDLFHLYFRLPDAGEVGEHLSATQIMSIIKEAYPTAMRKIPLQKFTRSLTAIGTKREHTCEGNRYHVVRLHPQA
jgi:predicted P-loop ATPase